MLENRGVPEPIFIPDLDPELKKNHSGSGAKSRVKNRENSKKIAKIAKKIAKIAKKIAKIAKNRLNRVKKRLNRVKNRSSGSGIILKYRSRIRSSGSGSGSGIIFAGSGAPEHP